MGMLIEHAKRELAAINFGDEDSRVMIGILKKFFDQWDSGGAVSVAAPVLQRLIAAKPLGPLTGEDSEWFTTMDPDTQQNMRCSTVFRERQADGSWRAMDIDLPMTDGEWTTITFPYSPDRAEVASPVLEIDA